MLDFKIRRLGTVPATMRRDPIIASFTVSDRTTEINGLVQADILASDWPNASVGDQFDVLRFDGSDWAELPSGHSRYVITRAKETLRDGRDVIAIEAAGLLGAVLKGGNPTSEEAWEVGGTPGQILRAIIASEQARGWAPGWTVDFDNERDSNGKVWTRTATMKFEPDTSLFWAVNQLVDQGFVEIGSLGTTVRAFNPKQVRVATNVHLSQEAGITMTVDFEDRASIVCVIDDDRVPHTFAGAPSPLGRMEKTSRSSGTVDPTTIELIGQQLILEGQARTSWTISEPLATTGAYTKWQLGDSVRYYDDGEWHVGRVNGISALLADGQQQVDIEIGDLAAEKIRDLARRIGAIPRIAGSGRYREKGGGSFGSGARVGIVDPAYAGDRAYGGLARLRFDGGMGEGELSGGMRSLASYRPEGGESVLSVASEGYSPIIYGRVVNPNQPTITEGPGPFTPLVASQPVTYQSNGGWRFLNGRLTVPSGMSFAQGQRLFTLPPDLVPGRIMDSTNYGAEFLAWVSVPGGNNRGGEFIPLVIQNGVLCSRLDWANPFSTDGEIRLDGITWNARPTILIANDTLGRLLGGVDADGIAWLGGQFSQTREFAQPSMRPKDSSTNIIAERIGTADTQRLFTSVTATTSGIQLSTSSFASPSRMERAYWDSTSATHTWQALTIVGHYYGDSEVRIAKTASGTVMLQGRLVGSPPLGPDLPPDPNELVATIPAGMRPGYEIMDGGMGTGSPIVVNPDGTIVDILGGTTDRFVNLMWKA